MSDDVLLARHRRGEWAWAEIRLDRPDKGNALTMPMIERLGAIATELAADRETRAVVIRGTGRFFCTGGDIDAWGALSPLEMGRDWILPGIDVFDRLAALPQPLVAAINGHALGGGLELAMAADLRVAVKPAKLGCPEATLGMIPGWGGTRRLAELIGPARARHLLLLGSPITAAQACEWGLVTAVADNEAGLDAQLDAWLDRLLANGPAALGLIKGLLAAVHADARHHHAAAAAEASATGECKALVRAFTERRRT